ncbi:hypothetical protein MKX01_004481 [Papaver californicum]|nr:hypothetical protein MKX01_004481 [Papaver californicum]
MEKVSQNDQETQAIIWKQIYGFAESLVLKCAVQLEIAESIHNHGTSISLSELVSKLPIPQPVNLDRLNRVMRYLVDMKLFNKEIISTLNGGTTEVAEKYSLAPPAKYLIRGTEHSMVPSILGIIDEDLFAPWHIIKDNFIMKALGKTYADYMGGNAETNQIYNEAMAFDSGLLTSALVDECKSAFCDGIKTPVDVGGGTGPSRQFRKRSRIFKCSLFDLPHAIADSPEIPTITKISGDMFKTIPSADTIFMKNFLHDWSDDECILILKGCKEAVSQGGKLIIVEMVLDTDSKLIEASGFASYKITQMSAGFAAQSVIEVY